MIRVTCGHCGGSGTCSNGCCEVFWYGTCAMCLGRGYFHYKPVKSKEERAKEHERKMKLMEVGRQW